MSMNNFAAWTERKNNNALSDLQCVCVRVFVRRDLDTAPKRSTTTQAGRGHCEKMSQNAFGVEKTHNSPHRVTHRTHF